MYSSALFTSAVALSLAASVVAKPQLSFGSNTAAPPAAGSSSSTRSSSTTTRATSAGSVSYVYAVPSSSAVAPRSSSTSSSSVAPSSSSVAPSSTYVAPSSASVAPSSSYVAPSSSYVAPSSSYVAPSSSYVAPSSSYVAPSSSYVAPSSSYVAPEPSYVVSVSSYVATPASSYVAPPPASSYVAPPPAPAPAPAPGTNSTRTPAQVIAAAAPKVSAARLIPTVAERIALFENEEYEFDFINANTGLATGNAGHSVTASSLNFPALVGTGMSMTIGFLGPCGLNTPHTHPRATELNYVVNGSLRTGFLMENGARFVFNEARAGTVSVFPAGAIHFEQNNGCEPVQFVAHFNHEDGGVTAVAQRFFGLPPDIIGAALGGLTPEEVAEIETKIPNNIALGAEECLRRCGITRPALQMTSQRQGRNPGNALPAAFSAASDAANLYPASGSPPAASSVAAAPPAMSSAPAGYSYPAVTPAASSASAYAYPSSSAGGLLAAALGESTDSGSTNAFAASPLLIALVAVNGVFVLGALVGMFVCLRRRNNSDKRGKYINPSAYKVGMVEHQEYEDVPYNGSR